MDHIVIASSFMMVMSALLFISTFLLIINFKKYASERDKYHDQRLAGLEKLMINQFQEILETLKK